MTRIPHSWRTPLGAASAGATDVTISDRGAVRWAIDVPFRSGRSILASRDGRWVVANDGRIVVGDSLTIRWQLETRCWPPALADDGTLILPRSSCLSAHQLDDGDECWRVEGPHGCLGDTLQGGDRPALRYDQSQWVLTVIAGDGGPRWEAAVDEPIGPPVPLGDLVVLPSRSVVTAFVPGGDVAWRASVGGFDRAAARPEHHFTSHAFRIDDHRLGVGADSFDTDGFDRPGMMIIDAQARTAVPWRAPNGVVISTMSPYAVSRHHATGGLALVVRHQATMDVIALDGSTAWDAKFCTPPVAFATDPGGRVAVAYTHNQDYHDAYAWHDEGKALRGRCGVAVFDADGHALWSWDAPGPIGGLAVAADGAILITSQGKLWALG
jgi:hypothetical protein